MKNSILFKKMAVMITAVILIFIISGCKKLIEIDPPGSQLLGSETFKDSISVQQNVAGLYANFISTGRFYLAPSSTLPAMSADELQYLGTPFDAFINNGLISDNGTVAGIWSNSYSNIYIANSIIGNINTANTISETFRNQVTAEARFLRAMSYFYLLNYFGDIPLQTGIDINANSKTARTPAAQVYAQIVADLQFAENNLPSTYAQTGNVRTRATSWAAKALLSRVYLYLQQWQNAEAAASSVISNTALFSLPTDLTQVFTARSNEAIFQFYNDLNGYTNYASTVLPNAVSKVPTYYLRQELVNSFETGDARKAAWTATVTYLGTVYTYPNKYKSLVPSANAEYYTVLRLAEQYLIRAEARAQLSNLGGALADLNSIRSRAGLPAATASTQQNLLSAIAMENRIEFNCEWGHRWFDLKRTGTVNTVIGALKPTWKPTAALYPIPVGQIQLNTNLTPNPGY